MISPTGKQSAYFGGLLSREEDEDAESESEGGLFRDGDGKRKRFAD